MCLSCYSERPAVDQQCRSTTTVTETSTSGTTTTTITGTSCANGGAANKKRTAFPVPVPSPAPAGKRDPAPEAMPAQIQERAVPKPSCLKLYNVAAQITAACKCLSIPTPVTTATTEPPTSTETTQTTVQEVATRTLLNAPSGCADVTGRNSAGQNAGTFREYYGGCDYGPNNNNYQSLSLAYMSACDSIQKCADYAVQRG